MLKKKQLWHGLSLVFSILLCFCLTVSIALSTFSATIDTALGTRSSIVVSEDDGTLYSTFTPEADHLNSDGTGNSYGLIANAIELGRQISAEGSVLLKNDMATGLPLDAGTKITMLGIRSEVPLIGAGFGVSAKGPYIPFDEALSNNETDFQNEANWASTAMKGTYATMEDHKFEGGGFKVNPVMLDIYAELNKTIGHKVNGAITSGEISSDNAAFIPFDPQEPSLADIARVNSKYQDSFADYGDAAIVMVGRPGSEAADYLPGMVADGLEADEPLELTKNERDLIDLATENFETVIVIVNSTSAMEIEELEQNEDVDSILWIGFPGSYGFLGVSDIISGKVSPSAGLPDTYAVKNMSAPAMMNMGDFTFANADEITRVNSSKYLMEVEGIYVGYRYYETRYNDVVMGLGNADSTAGTYASTGNWNYDEEVAYPFGYGLSYTSFTQEIIGTPKRVQTAHEIAYDFEVKVTNTGDYAGKSIVQIYGQAPYIDGGLEKSAIQLLAFDKTQTLEAGESETLTIKVDLQDLASYDSAHVNADGTKGTYVLDAGEYYLSMGNGSHDALNNVLAAQGKTTANSKMDADGDASKVFNYTEETYDDVTFSITKNDVQVENNLNMADWNNYEGASEVINLSRSDWEGTYPITYDNLVAPASMLDDLNGKYYELETEDDTSEMVWDSDVTSHLFFQLSGAEFEDYRWEELLNQMSIEESMYLAAYGGPIFPSVPSIGFVEAYLLENCGNGMTVPLNASQDIAAPWTISDKDPNASWTPQVFASSPTVAASFNPDLFYDLGKFVGEEALFTGLAILWGPGLNTHRHAYNGRNCEYYSEDAILAGNISMEYAMGAATKGLIASPKHYAFNDQETNRKGVAPFMTEQRAREVELRGYQIAMESNKYDDIMGKDVGMMGLMTSFSKIGAVEIPASRGMMTDILKEEWGFHGYAVTDIFDDTDLYSASVYAGITAYDIRGASGFYDKTSLFSDNWFANQTDGIKLSVDMYEGDLKMQQALKESNHNTLWAFSQSNLMNRYNASTRVVPQMTWWRATSIATIVVTGGLMLGSIAMYVLCFKKTKEEEEVTND